MKEKNTNKATSSKNVKIFSFLKELSRLRKQVEHIDQKILTLLASRFSLTQQIQLLKKANGMGIFQKSREEELLKKYRSLSKGKKLAPGLAEKLYRLIFSYSKKAGIMKRIQKTTAWKQPPNRIR